LRAALFAFALFLPAVAHADTDPNAPQGKLPDTVAPVAYRLDMTIVPEQPRFTGHVEIDVNLKKAASSFYMHGRDLHVSKAVALIDGKPQPVTFTQVTPTGAARVDFGKTVQPGKMTLVFDYDGAFGDNPSGLYRIKVGDDWYSWTQFESIDARAAFPSFDEPGFKTPFKVSITTRPGFVTASNAQETGTVKAGPLVKHEFAQTLPLPTYLVAMVTGPFITAEGTAPVTPQRAKPLPIRVIATKAQAGKLDFAAKESGKIVALLENYFGQPFPFPKLDQIGSPVMPGAMENAGADIYGDDILLLDPNATTADKQGFGMVVAHELSHQWFGDLATPAWWSDIWLNESFANWMGYRIGNEWRPDLNIGVNAIDEGLTAMRTDALKAGRPIHQLITKDGEIDAAFDNITYGKGGQVVAMIAAYMGDEKFRDGVRLHMQRHAYGNASTEDFFASLAAAAHDPRVLESLRSFVDQQGVPVVTFHRAGDKLTASQAPYAFLGSAPGTQQWTIPVCVRTGTTKNCQLIDKAGGTVTAAPGTAVMPNAGGTGYYRFDLDPADWDTLIATSATLSPGEALAMDDSLWARFYAGKGNVAQLIAATRAMAANPYSGAAVDNGAFLAGLDARGLVSDAAKPAWRKIFADTYGPMLTKLGFDPAEGVYANDDPDRSQLRQTLVGLLVDRAEDPATRATLAKAADAYIAGNAKALDPAFLQPALTVAVEDKGLGFAKGLTDKALASEDPTFRRAALGAVIGGANHEIANWFLNDLKDERLRGVERIFLVAGLMKNPETRDLAATYLLANYDALSASNGIFVTSRIPQFFGGACSLDQASALEAKLGPKIAASGTGELAFQRTLEQIRNCAKLRDARATEVSAALIAAK